MIALATQLDGVVAASTAVVGRAHLARSAAGATSVMAAVALALVLQAAARNRATAGVPADTAGGGAAAAIGASSATVAEDAPNLAEVVESKARAVQKVEEGGDGTVGRLMDGLAIEADAKTTGVPGSMVRRGIAMATKRGAKTAASGTDEVKTTTPAARATTGVTIVTEGTPFSTGDSRHQHCRICRLRWTTSAWLRRLRRSAARRRRRAARRTTSTVLPQSIATHSTATLNAMDRRQTPHTPLRRHVQQYLLHEPCRQPLPRPRLPFSLLESAGEKPNRHGVCTA